MSAGDIEERHGTAAIAERYLNEGGQVKRLSNWEFELSETQLRYAARDAAVLIPLREKLIERIKSLRLIKCAQLEFECVMPVVDLETGRLFHGQAALAEQLSIVEERGETANELQEMLGEGVAQASFWPPARTSISIHSSR